MTTKRISDAEYAAALAAGRTEAEIEIRAQAVRYVPERDAIEIVTNHNAGFLIPRKWSLLAGLRRRPTHRPGTSLLSGKLGHDNIATTRIYDQRKMKPEDSPTLKGSY